MKLPMPQPGSSTVAPSGTPRRRIARCMACMTTGEVKNWLKVGPLGGIVFFGREQGFELVAEGLPAGVLVTAARPGRGTATGPPPRSRRSGTSMPRSSVVAGRRSRSMLCSVRMAAMMSRALPFSPLAMTGVAGVVSVPSMVRCPSPVSGPDRRGLSPERPTDALAGSGSRDGQSAGAAETAPAGPAACRPGSSPFRNVRPVIARPGGGCIVAEEGPGGAGATGGRGSPEESGRAGTSGSSPGRALAVCRDGGPNIGSRDWPREALTRAANAGG